MEATTNKNKSSTQGKWTSHRSSRPLGLLDRLASKIFSKCRSLIHSYVTENEYIYELHETEEITDCSVFLLNVYHPTKGFPPKVYRMLRIAYDNDDNNVTGITNTNNFNRLCLSTVLIMLGCRGNVIM